MNKTILAVLATAALSFGLQSAQAADAAASAAMGGATAASAPLTKEQAKDLKKESNADYAARKKVADANLDLNKADCEVAASGAVARDCKKTAKAHAKQQKAAAKTLHEAEKKDIKDNTQ